MLTYADVKEILIENKHAVGVRMADGHEIRAAQVISNAGVINTFEKLLPERPARCAIIRPTANMSVPDVTLGMYIGLGIYRRGAGSAENKPGSTLTTVMMGPSTPSSKTLHVPLPGRLHLLSFNGTRPMPHGIGTVCH